MVFTIKGAAQVAGLTYAQIRWAVVNGRLKATKKDVGPVSYYEIEEQELERYLQKRRSTQKEVQHAQ